MTDGTPQALARDRSERLSPKQAAARGIAVALASTIAAFHMIWIPHKLATAPYMGGLFMALGIGALVAAVLLGVAGTRLAPLAWGFAAFFAAVPFGGYVWSRLSAWPQQEELVGNWGSALGVPSLVVEALLFVLAVAALAGAFDEASAREAHQLRGEEKSSGGSRGGEEQVA